MKNELQHTLKILVSGKVILYPTDTVWGLGCDATDEKAVAQIYTIKQRIDSKSMIILVAGMTMLQKYVGTLTPELKEFVKGRSNPTTIIYNDAVGLAKNVISADGTIAIRIVQNEFCKKLIRDFGKPIVSTSANISGKATPLNYDQIEEQILEAVDYSVNLQRDITSTKSSTILKMNQDGSIKVLRE